MDSRTKTPHFLGTILVTVILGIILCTSLTYANLTTSVGLVPNRTPIALSPGETGTYPVTIHNGQGRSVTLTFQATVVSFPPGAIGEDLSLTFPSTITARPGNTRVSVTVTVAGDAAPGTYTIENSIIL